MKDFENARQVLKELEAINNPQNKLGEVMRLAYSKNGTRYH